MLLLGLVVQAVQSSYIAILLFSKRADYLTVGKLSLGPGIFNINEPIMFGLPVVLNQLCLFHL